MKEFLKTNTVTYNLMSFTGFKSIFIFSLLCDGPKSYKELKKAFRENEYLHEEISVDTLRIYLNSLRKFGCEIEETSEGRTTKFSIASHPFELKIDNKQAKSIIKIYKAISKSIDIEDLIALQKFFEKIAEYINDKKLKETLIALSPINKLDIELVNNLLLYSKDHAEITICYKSANRGNEDIIINIDKLAVNNSKLYIYGMNSLYNNYSSFLVSNIDKIINVNYESKILETPQIIVQYEYLHDPDEDLELLNGETIVSQSENKYLIEYAAKSKFEVMQRILHHNYKCKVISPEYIKNEVIETLKKMKEGYLGE